jgi:alanyl-tRNA synthetase
MERQREQAREHWKGSGEEGIAEIYKKLYGEGIRSTFVGYHERSSFSVATVLIRCGERVDAASTGDEVEIITEVTPFYGEAGGQIGDTGRISGGNSHLRVDSTIRPFPDMIVHRAKVLEGTLRLGEGVDLIVADNERSATARNHTATHLLQSALRQVLGEHIKQAGSLVTPERLRFDFTHFAPLTEEEIEQVETTVNDYIMENSGVNSQEMSTTEAMGSGAIALFGEKYGDKVRVVKVGDVSSELCGGTHVHAAGDIGFFKIISETGIAAGVRRIEALTGKGALHHVRQLEDERKRLASLLKSEGGDPVEKVERLILRQKELQREIDTLQSRLNASASADMMSDVKLVSGVNLLTVKLDKGDPKKMRELSDTLKERIGSGIIALACDNEGKANILVAVTKDLTGRFNAGRFIKAIAPVIGGSGGGKPDLAQAGGNEISKLNEALEMLPSLVESEQSAIGEK